MKQIMSSISPRKPFWPNAPLFVKRGLLLAFAALTLIVVLSGAVHAAGGVGSGGSGGGGSGGHQTSYGWSWAIYDISDPGPTNNFRNGDTWANVKAICEDAGSSQVYAHIVYNAEYKAKVYDYKAVQDSPYTYAGKFSPGTPIDGGGVTISTEDAQAKYVTIDDEPYDVNTSGFTWGQDVAWFCYNYTGTSTTTNGSCTISVPTTLTTGENFTATFSIENTGDTAWSVHPTNANRFKLGSQSPQDNTRWGTNRKEIAGDASAFGLVVTPGSTKPTSPSPATFTAPTTPGTYAFAWRVVEEGVAWHGSTCSVTITVTEEEEEDLCLNIPGIQATIPAGMERDAAGNCAFPVTDLVCNDNNDNNHIPDLSDVPVTLPETAPADVTAPGSKTDDSSSVTESQRYGVTRIDSVEDISSGGSQLSIPYEGGTDYSVSLDYRPFADAYPFDTNKARVNYSSKYRQRLVTYTWSYSYDETHCNAYEALYDDEGNFDGWGDCISETEHTHHVYAANYGSWGDLWEPGSADGPVLNPCHNRTYDSSPSVDSATIEPDQEMPNITRLSGNIGMAFHVTEPSRGWSTMRKASQVNDITYELNRYIRRANGSTDSTTSETRTITVTGTTNKASNGSVSATQDFAVSVPGILQVGDRVCWRITMTTTSFGSREHGIMRNTGEILSGSGTQSAEDCTPPVVNWPYFEVFGNDVVSGGQFGGVCGVAAGQGIQAYSRPGQYRGASVQYAAFALGTISGVTTVSLRDGASTPAIPPFGLTFSNETGGYGGSYSGSDGMTCLPDYFAARPATTEDVPGIGLPAKLHQANDSPRRIEYLSIDHDVTLGSLDVPEGVKKVVYVNGTLRINNGVTLDDAWDDRENIPFVMFIARDIVIGRNVTRLDGVYVAQPGDGGAGGIRTCDTNSYALCSNPLVVNGALIADKLDLLRTRGSHRDSVVNEGRPGVDSAACSNGARSNAGTPGGQSCAAEIISFSPELFLALSQVVQPEESFQLDSYITLPPNL